MVLDTGATRTLISGSHLLATGYDPSTAAIRMETTTASGVEYTPCVTVQRLRTLGQERSDFPVLALTLPPSAGVDGLLGLDFFRDRVLSIDFRSGLIALD
jgi:predicted aspartyl protease